MPRTSYIVCSTPRTGSNMLCFGLKETGICGEPVEYFNPFTSVPSAMEQDGHANIEEYVEWVVRERSGPNGVLGVKMHRGQFHFLIAELKKMRPYQGLSEADTLDQLFGKPRYIYMTRRDKVRQAVSWVIALQTANWMEEHNGRPSKEINLSYDFFALYARHQMLVRHDLLWTDYFARNGIRPLEIVYEDMVHAYAGTVERVLNFLDLDQEPARKVLVPPTASQKSRINDIWVEKYNHSAQWPGKLHQFFLRAAGKLRHAS